MTVNPEQPVLDAIAELVDWQLEEGRRRGDGPAEAFDPAAMWPGWTTAVGPILGRINDQVRQAVARDRARLFIAEPDESHLTGPCLACGHRARMYSLEEMAELNRIRWKLPPNHPLALRGCPHDRDDCPLLTLGPTRGARGDSSSAPGIDTISSANGEQSRR